MLCLGRSSVRMDGPLAGHDAHEALLSTPIFTLLWAPQFLKKLSQHHDYAPPRLSPAFLFAAAPGHIPRYSAPRAMPQSTLPITEGEAREACAYAPI
jgi:hypothetical protein